MISKEIIQKTLESLNNVENNTSIAPEDKVKGIDSVVDPDTIGSMNGNPTTRESDRQFETFLFMDFPDYHREFVSMLICDGVAAVEWKFTGNSTSKNKYIEVVGSSHFEFNEEGKVCKYQLYADLTPFY